MICAAVRILSVLFQIFVPCACLTRASAFAQWSFWSALSSSSSSPSRSSFIPTFFILYFVSPSLRGVSDVYSNSLALLGFFCSPLGKMLFCVEEEKKQEKEKADGDADADEGGFKE